MFRASSLLQIRSSKRFLFGARPSLPMFVAFRPSQPLLMVRPTPMRLVSIKTMLGTEANVGQFYYVKFGVLMGFVLGHLVLNRFILDDIVATQELENDRKEMLHPRSEHEKRMDDPRRPPWPVLHERVTMMREGKSTLEDIGLVWEQTKHYYPGDWLLPMEITQILKYTTGKFLSQFVSDPEMCRKEVLHQLLEIQADRAPKTEGDGNVRLTVDVAEIIESAIHDLQSICLDETLEPPLVPSHTVVGGPDLQQ